MDESTDAWLQVSADLLATDRRPDRRDGELDAEMEGKGGDNAAGESDDGEMDDGENRCLW
jgi:hypothetical protein